MDEMQGGRSVNPDTGLREYSMFGKILKAVARIGATTAGFMYGGPMGAAAANAAATKLTGGSWKQAAIGGVTSGLTAGIGNYASGSPLMSSGNNLASNAASGFSSGSIPGIATPAGGFASNAAPSVATGWASRLAPAIGTNAANYLGTGAGTALAAGAGLSAFGPSNKKSGPPTGYQTPAMPPFVPHYSDDYMYGIGKHAPPQQLGMGASPQQLMNSDQWGYVNAKAGGSIHGPGTGTSDDIPAMLSDGEHVIDAQSVTDAGGGSNDKGQKVIEHIKQVIRHKAGRKNPKSPTSPLKDGLGSFAHARS